MSSIIVYHFRNCVSNYSCATLQFSLIQNFNGVKDDIEIPQVQNGYWFIYDRHDYATNKYDDKAIFENSRPSYNLATLRTFSNSSTTFSITLTV